MTSEPPAPHELWRIAYEEHPDDRDARKLRYLELMTEHGYILTDSEHHTADNPPPWINRHRHG